MKDWIRKLAQIDEIATFWSHSADHGGLGSGQDIQALGHDGGWPKGGGPDAIDDQSGGVPEHFGSFFSGFFLTFRAHVKQDADYRLLMLCFVFWRTS